MMTDQDPVDQRKERNRANEVVVETLLMKSYRRVNGLSLHRSQQFNWDITRLSNKSVLQRHSTHQDRSHLATREDRNTTWIHLTVASLLGLQYVRRDVVLPSATHLTDAPRTDALSQRASRACESCHASDRRAAKSPPDAHSAHPDHPIERPRCIFAGPRLASPPVSEVAVKHTWHAHLEFGSTPSAHLAFAAAAMVRLRVEPCSLNRDPPQGMLLWVTADSASAEEKEEALRGEEESEKEAEPPALEAKYLVVGGGTAAFSAIKELKRLDPNAKVSA